MFYIFKAFVWLISFLPLQILYLFSDLLYPLIYHLVRYRRKVVRENLINSFPERDLKEIIKIEKKFYLYFCDLFIETIYLTHMSDKEARKRMKFEGVELVQKQFEAGKSVMLMSAHYCNWEWTAALSLHLPFESPAFGIYKRLSNKSFDQFMIKLRESYNSKTIEKLDLYRTLLRMRNSGKFGAFGMISDQTPKAASTRHWTKFLNQDTAVMVGTEELARRFDYPVIFANITRVKRGYYCCKMELIEENPKKATEYEITDRFSQILETKINEHPEFWLWTHKRWKQKKAE